MAMETAMEVRSNGDGDGDGGQIEGRWRSDRTAMAWIRRGWRSDRTAVHSPWSDRIAMEELK